MDNQNKFAREAVPDFHEIEDNTDWEATENEETETHDETTDSDTDISETADENIPLHIIVKHEAKRLSLLRQERAARTQEDFEELITTYDSIDNNRIKREKRYEKANTEDLKYYALKGHQRVFPQPLDHTWWRELLNGNFLDVIHNCPHEIQEFFASRIMFELLGALKATQKEVLYYRAIRGWSNQLIATLRGQTDRNILKTYETLIESLRYRLYMRLLPQYKAEAEARILLETAASTEPKNEIKLDVKFILTASQKRFMQENEKKYGEGKSKRIRRTKVQIAQAANEAAQ